MIRSLDLHGKNHKLDTYVCHTRDPQGILHLLSKYDIFLVHGIINMTPPVIIYIRLEI